MKRHRIMIVEDEPILAEFMNDLLTRNGYIVTSTVHYGEHAADRAVADSPDLVLMDIKLRGEMDGVAAAAEIRKRIQVPIVFLTAYADGTTLQRVKSADVFGYVQKPFKEGDLRSAIEIALYRHEMEDFLREREESYRVLAENLPGIVYRRSLENASRLVFFNGMVRPMTGYDPSEITADATSALASLIVPDDIPAASERAARAMAEGEPFSIEYRIRHRDGTLRYFVERGSRIEGGRGGSCIDGVIFDLTERRRMEEELAEAYSILGKRNEFIESVVAGIESGILVTDAEMNVSFMNPYALQFLGRSPENQAQPLHSLLPEVDELLRRGVTASETPLKSIADDCVIGFSHSSLKNHDGIDTGHIITFKDLSEVVKFRRQMRLKARLATIGEVVARVAHEMRNPLFAITSVGQILAMELQMTPPQKELMDLLFTEARRLNRLVEELLDYTKEVKLQRKDFDLLSLLNHCVDLNQPFIGEKCIRVEKGYSDGTLTFPGDLERLQQVFLNIIKNAVDATPAGGVIRISAACTGAGVEIVTRDGGPGIPVEIIDKIFDLFYTTKKNGTGLGLSISRKLVEAHGGSLSAANAGEGGASFTVFLPLGETA